MRDVKDLAIDFYAACREAGIGCAFIGGLAVMAWGQPRATSDVDVLIQSDEKLVRTMLEEFAQSLASRGLSVDPLGLDAARRDGGPVTIHDDGSVFHVDAVFARTPAGRSEIERAVMVSLAGGAESPSRRPRRRSRSSSSSGPRRTSPTRGAS